MGLPITERLVGFSCGFMRDYAFACTALEIVTGEDYKEYYEPFWKVFVDFTKEKATDARLKSLKDNIYDNLHKNVMKRIPPEIVGEERVNLTKRPESGKECIELVEALYKSY